MILKLYGLLFVEEYDSKVAYDYNNGNNIEDCIVHERLPFRFYRPQIDDNRQYSSKNIESQKIHCSLSFFDNFTDILKKDTVIAIPIENVSQGFMPVAPGTNAPTTKEANKIFAPSKKKSETISSLSLSNIYRKFTTQSAICQDEVAAELALPDDSQGKVNFAATETLPVAVAAPSYGANKAAQGAAATEARRPSREDGR